MMLLANRNDHKLAISDKTILARVIFKLSGI